jgi:hypothetical protein
LKSCIEEVERIPEEKEERRQSNRVKEISLPPENEG